MNRVIASAATWILAAGVHVTPALAQVVTIDPPTSRLGPTLEEAAATLDAPGGRADAGEHDAILLYSGTEVRVTSDGRMSLRRRSIRMLLTDYAVGHYGDVRIPYDTTLQALTIHEMRTLTADRRVIEAKPRAFNRVTPERVARCTDRAAAQEMVVSHLGVERGSLIVLDTTIEDRVPFRPWFEGEIAIVSGDPVRSGEILLSVPAGVPLKTEVRRIDPALLRTLPLETDGSRRMVYGPLPAIPDEGGGNPREAGGALIFSTCGSWDDVIEYAQGRIEAAAVPDSSLHAWASRPMPGGRMPMDARDVLVKAAALIGTGIVPADDPGIDWWRPVRPATRTMDCRCGNLLDRAALALAGLRVSGYAPRLALKPALAGLPSGVPGLLAMEDVWLSIEPWTLSVSESAAGPAPDPGWAASLLERRDGASVWIPAIPAKIRSDLRLDIRQADDGSFRADARLDVTGPLHRLFDPGDPAGMLAGLATDWLDGGKLLSYRVERAGGEDLAISFSLEGRALGDSLGRGRRRWTLPAVPGLPNRIIPEGCDLSRTERATPLVLRATVEEHLDVRLHLRAASGVLLLPDTQQLRSEGMELNLACTREGTDIHAERSFAVRLSVIPPDRYREFRELLVRRSRAEGMSIYGEWEMVRP